MTEGAKNGVIKILVVCVMLTFPAVTGAAEEDKKDTTGEVGMSKFAERETMLNLMPSLKISKKTSVKYSIMQQFEYIDNFNLSRKDIESRFASISSPGVSIKYSLGRSYLEGDYEYGFTYYMGHDYINRHNANVRVYHRPTRRLSMGLTDGFTISDRPEMQRDIDVKVPGETFSRNTLSGEIKYEINKRLRCGLDGGYSFFRFKNEPSDVSANMAEFNGGGVIDYVIGRRTTISGTYNLQEMLFRDTNEKNGYKHSIGLSYSDRARKTFNVNVFTNYNLAHYRDGEDINGFTAGTTLGFDPSRFTKFTLTYNYIFENSSRADYLVYRTHGIQGSLRHNITPRLMTNVNSSYDLRLYAPEYRVSGSGAGSDRMNSTIIFECGITYKLMKMVDIGATYNTNAKFSDFDDDSYFVNHYLLTIRAAF